MVKALFWRYTFSINGSIVSRYYSSFKDIVWVVVSAGNEDTGAVCNACSYHWCLGCGKAWHTRKACDQHLQACHASLMLLGHRQHQCQTSVPQKHDYWAVDYTKPVLRDSLDLGRRNGACAQEVLI